MSSKSRGPCREYLTGAILYLRPIERGDLSGDMQYWANDPEVTRYMYLGTLPSTLEGLYREYEMLTGGGSSLLLQSPTYPQTIIFAIIDRATDKHVGNVGFWGINWINRTAELRFLIGNGDYRRRGYAREALTLAVGYAFDRLNLRRIHAGCRADNEGSAGVMRHLGFVIEGRLREEFLRDETAYDILTLGLLRKEFCRKIPSEPVSSESLENT